MFKSINGVDFYKTPYEGYLVSKCGKIVSFRKPAPKSLIRVDYNKKPKFLSYKTDKDGYF